MDGLLSTKVTQVEGCQGFHASHFHVVGLLLRRKQHLGAKATSNVNSELAACAEDGFDG